MTELSQETRARRIIERLKMFNRKERDHLMKFALCEDPKTPEISLALWKKISNGGRRPNAERMFIGMDYHLNWLYAALATADDPDLSASYENKWHDKVNAGDGNKQPIKRSQEDVDLLCAWTVPKSDSLYLVLIEAKLDSSWGSKQFRSKKERLTLIREDAEARELGFINWQFLLMSPGDAPKKNEFDGGDLRGRYSWLRDLEQREKDRPSRVRHITLPVTKDLWRVKRVSKSSKNWTTVLSKPANQ